VAVINLDLDKAAEALLCGIKSVQLFQLRSEMDHAAFDDGMADFVFGFEVVVDVS